METNRAARLWRFPLVTAETATNGAKLPGGAKLGANLDNRREALFFLVRKPLLPWGNLSLRGTFAIWRLPMREWRGPRGLPPFK